MKNSIKYEKYRPKKFLGQNFLTDDNISKKIVSYLDIEKGDNIIEIGPGHGALTKHLINYDINFTAIEYDKFVFEELNKNYNKSKKIKLINEDFLKVDLKELSVGNKIKVIGNIPYNITSQILFKLIENYKIISKAVLMMQKEVAQRLKAEPHSKEYGILSVFIKIYTTPKIVYNVPPGAFFPKPKVESSVVTFDFKGKVKEPNNILIFKEVVKTSFNQRRKTLRNSLRNLFIDKNIDVNNIKFDLSKRPEMLSIDEFMDLSDNIYYETKNHL